MRRAVACDKIDSFTWYSRTKMWDEAAMYDVACVEELSDELEEGRALYERRVSPDLYRRNFYDRAVIDILVRSKGHVACALW